MKWTFYIISILLVSCSAINKQTNIVKHDNSVIKTKKRITPPSIDYDKFFDTTQVSYIYQFSGLDSSNKTLSKIVKYDKDNRILSEQFQDFKKSSIESTANVINYYDYKNRLLVQRRTVYTDNSTPSQRTLDSAKTVYFYDDENRLVKRQHYTYKRRLRPDVDKGNGRPGGCIIVEEDYEKERTWDISGEILFSYDSLGRKTEYYAPEIFWGNQNRYTWKYFPDGQIKEHSSFDHDKLYWIEEFEYTDTSYQFTRTWYDHEGNPKHLKEKSWEYTPQVTIRFKLDNQGRVIKESKVNEKGEILNYTITDYNTTDLVSKIVRYNKDEQPDMTHIFKYKNE